MANGDMERAAGENEGGDIGSDNLGRTGVTAGVPAALGVVIDALGVVLALGVVVSFIAPTGRMGLGRSRDNDLSSVRLPSAGLTAEGVAFDVATLGAVLPSSSLSSSSLLDSSLSLSSPESYAAATFDLPSSVTAP
jgi:hypothetical protein